MILYEKCLENPRHRKRESPPVKPKQEYEDKHAIQPYVYPSGHPKNEFELIQVPTYHKPIQTPTKVLGKGCNSSNDCTQALHAICSVNSRCHIYAFCGNGYVSEVMTH